MPCIGRAGTVYLAHPHMLHSSSQNTKRQPRFMRNGTIPLAQPQAFDPQRLSPVERCSLRNLGRTAEQLHQCWSPPPDELRRAADHNDGGLLPWRYGEKPSYREPEHAPKTPAEQGCAREVAAAIERGAAKL